MHSELLAQMGVMCNFATLCSQQKIDMVNDQVREGEGIVIEFHWEGVYGYSSGYYSLELRVVLSDTLPDSCTELLEGTVIQLFSGGLDTLLFAERLRIVAPRTLSCNVKNIRAGSGPLKIAALFQV